MSIAGDLLAAATPTRLVCRRGTWRLEVVRLVAVDRNVYQPRTQRIEGSEAILQHLKRTGDPSLASAAAVLIRSTRTDQESSFEAADSEWLPCEPKPQRDSSRPSAPPAAGSGTAELRAELFLLRAAHDGLRERVARLEALVARGGPRDLLMPPGTPLVVPRISDTPGSSAPSIQPAAQGSPTQTRVSPAREAEPAPEPAPEPAAQVSEARLKFPSPSAIATCLHTLIGKKVGVSEQRSHHLPAKSNEPCWFSSLIDDDGGEVGVIVADLSATVGLGGALMMVPPAELADQRSSKTPSEDVLSAMAEVANNLSGTFNEIAGGVHVRVRPLEPMTPGSLDWTKSAARASALELSSDLGKLYLFAR
jgi:hypothetical protein